MTSQKNKETVIENFRKDIQKEERIIKEEVHKEEKVIREEFKKEEKGFKWLMKSHSFRLFLIFIIFAALFFGVYYLSIQESRIYVENSQVIAPVIKLSSVQAGILDDVYVKEGDTISANTVVARVNGIAVKSKTSGIVINVQNTPGQLVTSQTTLIEMIDPGELRVVGRVQEDKGLSDIKKGQKVVFIADAFSGREYEGIVDAISPAARTGDIVFSISDKRQMQEYDVSVKYIVSSYPELLQGMSAKMWIYK